jgi:hypothetical protein
MAESVGYKAVQTDRWSKDVSEGVLIDLQTSLHNTMQNKSHKIHATNAPNLHAVVEQ